LQVLREAVDFPGAPFQWAAAGYLGAIHSKGSKTICGVLYGSTAFLGFLCGRDEAAEPAVEDAKRRQAIAAVNGLFSGFLERFGATECHTLTRCDHSIPEEVDRFRNDEVYRDSCLPQFEYALSYCLNQIELAAGKSL
jgi:hypothetical protein